MTSNRACSLLIFGEPPWHLRARRSAGSLWIVPVVVCLKAIPPPLVWDMASQLAEKLQIRIRASL